MSPSQDLDFDLFPTRPSDSEPLALRDPGPGRRPAADSFTTTLDGITVLVDHQAHQPDRGAHFAGLRDFLGGPGHIPGPVRRVHVVSAQRSGEIRSYVLDEDGRLRLSGPCYTGDWTEMDGEVARVLNATIAPYTISAGGSVE